MASNVEHPQVSISDRGKGQAYQLMFTLHGKQVKRGTATTDFEKAKDYAKAVSKILVGGLLSDPPPETPDLVLDMLGIKRRNKKLGDDANEAWTEVIQTLISTGKPTAILEGKKLTKLLSAMGKVFDELTLLRQMLADRDAEILRIKKELKIQTDKSTAYEAIRVKEGREIAQNFEPRTLKQAVENYLSDDSKKSGTDADERYKEKSIRPWLNDFAEKIGENVSVLDVQTEDAIAYLDKRKGKQAVTTVKQIATYVCSLLEHQSGGLYPLGNIRAWIKSNLKDDTVDKPWYWLQPTQVKELLANAEKADGFSQYWADAMMIQHHLALRPEEIPMLQCEKVYRETDDKSPMFGKISHIYVCPIVENGIEIRRLKTLKSSDSLPVSSDIVRDAIERRLTGGRRLLFPRTPEECGCRKPRWKAKKVNKDRTTGKGKTLKKNEAKGKYEDDHKLWREKMWCRFYLKRLRAAAKKVDGINQNIIDSRTLRRTRGRDIVLATRSMYETAKFMRDDPETVAKHYTELLAMDVKVS